MPIKLLAIDLDGTLTDRFPAISTANQQAIARAMARGVRVALATGRAYSIAAKIAHDLKLNAPVISYHGGLVQDHRSGQILQSEQMPANMSRRLIKFAREKKLHLVMYFADENYTELPSRQMERVIGGEGIRLNIANNLLCLLDDDEAGAGPIKFLFIQPKRRNDRIYDLIAGEFGDELTITRSSAILVEALLPTISKGRALQVVAHHLDIPLSQTMAIGDQDNDVSMLEAAGLAVAMGNASAAARQAADAIAPPVEEDGVAWAIQTYILEENDNPNA
jgi:hypothetical protein